MDTALICVACRGSLERLDTRQRCRVCGREYASVQGIPLLLPELSSQHLHQRAYFDAEFATYTRYRVEPWRESFNRRIFAALRLEASRGPYLDIGVGGSGATVIEAARAGGEAVGCDLSVEGVIAAAQHAEAEGVAARTGFVVCAAEQLPFADSSFAAVSAIAVLEHLDDDEAAVREIARVLRPGGRAWVTVPHAYARMPPFLWAAYWLHDRRIGHKRHYGADRLRALFRRHRLELVEVQYTAHPVKLLQLAVAAGGSRAGIDVERLWWSLESRDLRACGRAWWALQLSAVFQAAG